VVKVNLNLVQVVNLNFIIQPKWTERDFSFTLNVFRSLIKLKEDTSDFYSPFLLNSWLRLEKKKRNICISVQCYRYIGVVEV